MFKAALIVKDILFEILAEKVEGTVEHPIVDKTIENKRNIMETKREHLIRRFT